MHRHGHWKAAGHQPMLWLVIALKIGLVIAAFALFPVWIGLASWAVVLHAVALVLVIVLAGPGLLKIALGSHLRARGSPAAAGGSEGAVLHGAATYDLLASVITLGGEARMRRRMLDAANLKPGDTVLDVACGTGTLAIAAAATVGSSGAVTGVDASEEMIVRARKKATRAASCARFLQGTAQALPAADQQFDVVLGTLMLHHLSTSGQDAFFREARRVLKPDGKLVLIDFAKGRGHGLLPGLRTHGTDFQRAAHQLEKAGFRLAGSGEVGSGSLAFVDARPMPDQAF